MNPFLFIPIFGVIGTSLAIAMGAGYFFLQRDKKRQLRERLGSTDEIGNPDRYPLSIMNAERGTARYIRIQSWVMSQVDAAGLKWTSSKVLTICIVCACAGGLFGLRVSRSLPRDATAFAFVPIALFAGLPFLYLARLRKKRLNRFEAQLPDALDFLARSMRVGNSLLMSLEMLVDESEEPLKSEFTRLTGEIRLGSPIAQPLQKLTDRVPLIDLRMFVSAVLLQRETGGNLGAVLTRIAASIRNRFRVRGQVDAAAAQAQLSARVISAMPFVVLGGILILSPGYLKIMTDESLGRKLLVAAAVGQLAGFLIMRKIVRIKV